MTTWAEDTDAPAAAYTPPPDPGSVYTPGEPVLLPPFGGWAFNYPAAVDSVNFRSAPDGLEVGTEFGFGGSADDGSAICSFTLVPGRVYELRHWINGSNAIQGSGTTQRLTTSIDRGDGGFLILSSRTPAEAPTWVESISTFTAIGPSGRLQVACDTDFGVLFPVGTFYWRIDDAVLAMLPTSYTEDAEGATAWTED